jgi:hypothetical protein
LEGGISQSSFKSASLVARVTMIGTEYVPVVHCDRHRGADCRPKLAGIFSIQETLKGSPKTLTRIRFDAGLCAPPTPQIGKPTWIAAVGDAERGYSFQDCMWFHPPEGGPLAEAIAQYQSRLKSLKEAVEQRPADPGALLDLATFLAEVHGRLESIQALDQLLAVEPLHREATLLKADQLAIGPDQSAVLDALAPYLAAHPNDRDALHRRVIALVRGDRLSDVPSDWRDFTGLHGGKFDFSKAKLNNASFRGNHLYQASFAEAELQRTDFTGAEVLSSSFVGADLTKAVMAKANLFDTDFRGAALNGADLTNARIDRADFTGTVYDQDTIWPAGFDPVAAGAQKNQ